MADIELWSVPRYSFYVFSLASHTLIDSISNKIRVCTLDYFRSYLIILQCFAIVIDAKPPVYD